MLYIIIFFLVLIQKTFFFNTPKPDIVLLLVVSVGLLQGSKKGAVLGFWAGFIQGLLFFPALGWSIISFCLVGFLSGVLAERIFFESVIFPLAVSILATLFYSLFFLGFSKIFYFQGFSFNFDQHTLFYSLLYNMILMIPVFYLCNFFFKESSRLKY